MIFLVSTILPILIGLPLFCILFGIWCDFTIPEMALLFEQDSENDHIYHSELFTLTKRAAGGEPQKLSFTVPIFEPHPPQYYIRAVSDSWLQAEAFYCISFQNLTLPQVFMIHLCSLTQLIFGFAVSFSSCQKPFFYKKLMLHSGSYITYRAPGLKTTSCDCAWQQDIWSLIQIFTF